MKIQVLKSKIHRVTVTEADLNYVGSIAICPKLMKASGLVENEKVLVANFVNGNRYETYAVTGGEGEIKVNGGGALYSKVGDILMIVSFALVDSDEVIKPKVVHVNKKNEILEELQDKDNMPGEPYKYESTSDSP